MNLAEVIRDLAALDRQNAVDVHQTDHDLLKKARLCLGAEWSLAANISIEAAQQHIAEALDRGLTPVASPA
jgi:RNA polymerase-interacting CarD/CdnL/TRCF family regulator